MRPDNRSEALEHTENLSPELKRIVAWALGALQGPLKSDKSEYELWVAAGRCRAPFSDLSDAFQELSIEDLYPDSCTPAQYTWSAWRKYPEPVKPHIKPSGAVAALTISHGKASPQVLQESDRSSTNKQPLSSIISSIKRFLPFNDVPQWKNIPTAALHFYTKRSRWVHASSWRVHWLQMIWPMNTDSVTALGISRMVSRINDNSASTIPNFAFIEPAFHPYRPWSELTCLAVWVGLVSKDVAVQNAAIDAMIENIEVGNAHPEMLAKILVKLNEGGWIKYNRLAASLEQIAPVSPLHRYVVCTIIDHFLAALNEQPRNVHAVLQVLFDQRSHLNYILTEQAMAVVSSIKGKGKAAKLHTKSATSSLVIPWCMSINKQY